MNLYRKENKQEEANGVILCQNSPDTYTSDVERAN